ncbi:MAG: PadR family transcriptional regulator [Candidatus Micrarchaeia archaeon]
MAEFSPLKRLARSLTTENQWLYVLSLLNHSNIYAYAMRGEIEKEFGWKPSLITCYLILYKLEKEGFITGKYEGRRKYYSITDKGKKALASAKRYLQALAENL